MNDQLAFEYPNPRARRTDPETSHGAAVIAISRSAENRAKVLAALETAGEHGHNDFELADITGVPQTSIGVRRGELVKAGLVTNRMVIGPDGQLRKDTRPSPSGSPSLVWLLSSLQRSDAAS